MNRRTDPPHGTNARKIRRVAILIESSTSWGAGLIRGVSRYAREHGPWSFDLEPRGRYEAVLPPSQWRGDGIIGRVIDPKQADSLRSLNVPVVNTSSMQAGLSFPTVTADEFLIGKMVADSFLENSFERFGYYPPGNRSGYVDGIEKGFRRTLEQAGHGCDRIIGSRLVDTGFTAHLQREALNEWLTSTEKPVGVLAWSATQALQVTDACVFREIAVPEDVAVVAGEFDELTCGISTPELSYVRSPTEEIGYEAARVLDRLMDGEVETSARFIPPVELVVSGSSNVSAVNDPVVRTALRFIHSRASQSVKVADVAAHLKVSKRFLEKRFESELGRGPAAELRSWRMQIAKKLLRVTDLQIAEIAERAGYVNAQSFSRAFRDSANMTPQQYRHSYRS